MMSVLPNGGDWRRRFGRWCRAAALDDVSATEWRSIGLPGRSSHLAAALDDVSATEWRRTVDF